MNSTAPDNLKILVVDDEPTLRLGFSFALKTENYEVETASNGKEAVDAVANEHFDAMVLDLRMPELDGIETLRKLRTKGYEISVILCSAHITSSTAFEALEMGCFDFLAKPVKPSDLRESVERLLPGAVSSQPMAQTLHHLRGESFDVALQSLEEEAQALTERQVSFWKDLITDLQDQRPLKVERYSEQYGHNLVPYLSFQDN